MMFAADAGAVIPIVIATLALIACAAILADHFVGMAQKRRERRDKQG